MNTSYTKEIKPSKLYKLKRHLSKMIVSILKGDPKSTRCTSETSEKSFTISCFIPKIYITNSLKEYHKIRGLTIDFTFVKKRVNITLYDIQVKRDLEHRGFLDNIIGYKHSHVPSERNEDSGGDLCFGRTPLAILYSQLKHKFSITKFETLLRMLKLMLAWESLEGVPHKKFHNIFQALIVRLDDSRFKKRVISPFKQANNGSLPNPISSLLKIELNDPYTNEPLWGNNSLKLTIRYPKETTTEGFVFMLKNPRSDTLYKYTPLSTHKNGNTEFNSNQMVKDIITNLREVNKHNLPVFKKDLKRWVNSKVEIVSYTNNLPEKNYFVDKTSHILANILLDGQPIYIFNRIQQSLHNQLTTKQL